MIAALLAAMLGQQHFSPINSTCPTEVILGSGGCGGAPGGEGAGLPAGLIVLSLTTCPAGYAEETSLSGKFVLGTVAANADVTDTGGANDITAVLSHTHPVIDGGHTHTQNSHNHTQDAHTHTQNSHNHTQDPHTHTLTGGATDDTSAPFPGPDAANSATVFAATGIQAATATNQAATATNQNATATNQAATAVNQSATTGVTTANPAGGVASIDNRPAFVKVIFCRKT